MNKMIARLFHATACATLLMSAASLAVAADPSDARKGVQTTINKVNELLQHNASARMIADAMYEGDLMITGEGEKVFYRGLTSFMGPLAAYVAGGSRCKLEVIDPIRHSGNLAVAFVFEHCKAAKSGDKDDDARIMYVFRKGPKGYRATMELFTWGTF